MFRQGDILVVPTLAACEGSIEPRDPQYGTVLALGESTNHRHKIADDGAFVHQSPKGRHLRLVVSRALTHEEHSPIEIPAGLYDLPRQVEWNDENDPRPVTD